jgi:hypothetical protein
MAQKYSLYFRRNILNRLVFEKMYTCNRIFYQVNKLYNKTILLMEKALLPTFGMLGKVSREQHWWHLGK